MKSLLRGALGAALLMLPLLAAAVGETWYASDARAIDVYADKTLNGEPSTQLANGSPVELLAQDDKAAQVRLPNGSTGWIAADYLSDAKPESLRVPQLQDENAQLRAELEALQSQMDIAQQQLAKLREHIPPEAVEASYEDPRLLRLMQENMDLKQRLAKAADALGVVEAPAPVTAGPGAVPLLWVLIAIGVTLLLGFIFGLLWLDRSIRRRHGGFRI